MYLPLTPYSMSCDKSDICSIDRRKADRSDHPENEAPMSKEILKIVDTSESLTLGELHELKKLAAMSKLARTIIAVVIGGVALLGADKIFDLMNKVTH